MPKAAKRGAKPGRVISSKGSRNVGNIVLQEWQKTPKQLLSEYCQKQKRSKPSYSRVFSEDGYRSRVRLVDVKNKLKDLNFVSNESYQNKFYADSSVALIALANLDGSRQYEKSLPEIFVEAWQSLAGRKVVKLGKKVVSSDIFKCNFCNKRFKKEFALVEHRKRHEGEPEPVQPDENAKSKKVAQPAFMASQKNKFSSEFSKETFYNNKTKEKREKYKGFEAFKRANKFAKVIVSSENMVKLEEQCLKYLDQIKLAHTFASTESLNDSTLNELLRYGFKRGNILESFKAIGSSKNLIILYAMYRLNDVPKLFEKGLSHYQKANGVNNKAKDTKLILQERDNVIKDYLDLHEQRYEQANYFLSFMQLIKIIQPSLKLSAEQEKFDENAFEEELQAVRAVYHQFELSLKHSADFIEVAVQFDANLFLTIIIHTSNTNFPCYPHSPLVVKFLPPNFFYLDKSLELFFFLKHENLVGIPHLLTAFENLVELTNTKPSPKTFRLSHLKIGKEKIKQPSRNSEKKKKSNKKLAKTSFHGKRSFAKLADITLVKKFYLECIVTDNYLKMLKQRKLLPTLQEIEKLNVLLKNDDLLIVEGATGCGKSTQIPQILLDLCMKTNSNDFNIVCCQPRRLAAIGVAERVAEETNSKIGDIIGYKIRHETKASDKTRLCYMTVGVLIRMLLGSNELLDITHIIIDEVHERSRDIDLLLKLVKDMLRKNRKVKIILMSATLNLKKMKTYFSSVTSVSAIKIPGRTFPVKEIFLDDLKSKGFVFSSQPLTSKVNVSAIKVVIKDILNLSFSGSVLIFLAGISEIHLVRNILQRDFSQLEIIILHGAQKSGDQRRAFLPASKGKRKVILSTNIAETSITINDVVFVLDSGLEKTVVVDDNTRISSLNVSHISQASAKQRQGRAGRVRSGFCYKLYTKEEFANFHPVSKPEILRIPLDKLLLQVSLRKSEKLDNLQNSFSDFIDPPPMNDVKSSISFLNSIGALENDMLTGLGEKIAILPMDVLPAKLCVFGCLFNLSFECKISAAFLSSKSIFLSPPDRNFKEINQKRASLLSNDTKVLESDHAFLIDLFIKWSNLCKTSKSQFCEEFLLDRKVLHEIEKLIKNYSKELKSLGLNSTLAPNKEKFKGKLLKATLCAGLYPSVANILLPTKKYKSTMSGNVEVAPLPQEIKYYYSSLRQRVFLHPQSTNFSRATFNSPWLIGSQILTTTKTFMRYTTSVSPYSLVFFSGTYETDYEKSMVVLESWIRLEISPKLSVLLSVFKRKLSMKLKNVHDLYAKDEDLQLALDLIVGDGYEIF